MEYKLALQQSAHEITGHHFFLLRLMDTSHNLAASPLENCSFFKAFDVTPRRDGSKCS
jgi:hypothetical protein